MGWPQITLAVVYAISWTCTLIYHGKPRTWKYDVGIATASLGLVLWLEWCGGFWGPY